MKKIKKYNIVLILTIALITIAMLGATGVFASQQQQQWEPWTPYESDTPAKYVLTYPDGSTETVDSYEKAQKKLDEWKTLVPEGKTDKNGVIELEGWAEEGKIQIIEKEVPAGYTADSTETEADLSEGETSIVNKKIVENKLGSEPKEDSLPDKAEPKENTGIENTTVTDKEDTMPDNEEPVENTGVEDTTVDDDEDTMPDNGEPVDKVTEKTTEKTVVKTVTKGANTSDNTNVGIWIMLMAVAASIGVIFIKRRLPFDK